MRWRKMVFRPKLGTFFSFPQIRGMPATVVEETNDPFVANIRKLVFQPRQK